MHLLALCISCPTSLPRIKSDLGPRAQPTLTRVAAKGGGRLASIDPKLCRIAVGLQFDTNQEAQSKKQRPSGHPLSYHSDDPCRLPIPSRPYTLRAPERGPKQGQILRSTSESGSVPLHPRLLDWLFTKARSKSSPLPPRLIAQY